jgi:hypothetical protein
MAMAAIWMVMRRELSGTMTNVRSSSSTWHACLAAAAFLLGCLLSPPPALAADPGTNLAAHLATYSMKLTKASQSSGVVAVKGAMNYAFTDACNGWTVENRTTMTLSHGDGDEVDTTWTFVTWESKDGLKYRFRVQSTRDGDLVEEIQGQATLDGPGLGGKAVFSKPEKKTVKLPKGTLFPNAHTLLLLDQAKKGVRVLSRVVFDGASLDSPHEVNAVIGPAIASPASVGAGEIDNPLLKRPSWRSQMAFFPLSGKEGTPSYEVSLRYFDNGIAQDVDQDFGNFAVRAKIETIEPLPKPDC